MARPRVLLSGPMGSGKSTVAGLVAAALDVPVRDLDAEIEARVGGSVAGIFADHGEDAFRVVEAEVLDALVAETAETGAAIALGGGAVTSRALRRARLRDAVLVTLDAPADVLAGRIGDARTRPLLAGRDATLALAALREARHDAYAECHGVIDTAALTPAEVAARVVALVSNAGVVVALGARTYRIEVGDGARHALAERIRAHARGACVLVTDEVVGAQWGGPLRDALALAGLDVVPVTLPRGEAAKTLAGAARIWDAALGAGVDRDAMVVALGGGAIGDVAGFAASTLLRGVAFAQVPSTLLAMVDSSVGGKTGIDRPEGKNLVGTFHQPRFVLCDVGLLATLPSAERRAGLGEVVKCALLSGEAALAALERDAMDLLAGVPDATERAIRMAIGLKADVVAEDELETRGTRILLNLGHTVGHALEAQSGYALRHGEAVALGLVAAARVSVRLGLADASLGARITSLLGALRLPTDLDAHLAPTTWGWLGADKKRSGGKVRFLAPAAPGDVRVVPLAPTDVERLCRP